MAGNPSAATSDLERDVRWNSLREMVHEAFRNHGGAVYSVAEGLSGSRIATEITRDVFLRLWSEHDRFDPAETSLRTFLLRLTHDAVRRRSRSIAIGRPPEQLLDGLSDDRRRTIVTIISGGCTSREAALILGQEEGAVRQSVRDALRSVGRARTRSSSAAPFPSEEADAAPRTDEGLSVALETRAATAQAEGMIMERGEIPSASAAAGRRRVGGH